MYQHAFRHFGIAGKFAAVFSETARDHQGVPIHQATGDFAAGRVLAKYQIPAMKLALDGGDPDG